MKKDSKTIYLNNYFYVLNKIYDGILSSLNYFQISFDDFDYFKREVKESNILYLVKSERKINMYFFAKEILQVRTKMFDLIENIKVSIKNICNLYIFESEEINDEIFHLGLIDENNKYVDVVKILLHQGDECYFDLELNDELVLYVLNLVNTKSLINDNLSPYLIGFVLLDSNRQGVNKYLKTAIEVLKDYTLLLSDLTLSKKGQYEFLEFKGVSFIIDINYRDFKKSMFKLKNVYTGEIIEVSNELIIEKLQFLIDMNNQSLYKYSVKNYLDYQKSDKVIFTCEECQNKLNVKDMFLLKPLAKNIIRNKCEFCQKKAVMKFFQI